LYLVEAIALIGEVAMSCEEYRPKLIEAAAMPAELNAVLQEHVDGCASCREFHAKERSLFVAIDAELSSAANAETTPSFLPRVRAAMEQERAAVSALRSLFVLWPVAAAMAAVAVLFVVFQRIPSQPQTAPQLAASSSATTRATDSATGSPTNSAANSESGEIASRPKIASREMASHSARNPRFFSTLVKTENRFGNSQMPEVLVPPDERIALARFVAALPRRHEIAIALTKPAPAAPSPNVASMPLEIAELKLEPLSPEQSPSEAE
jgi:hypothetical protein